MSKIDKKELLKRSAKNNMVNFKAKFNDIVTVQIKDITLNPHQPRKSFDDDKIKELSESIAKYGLLQPILITSDKVLIAGERRLRATILLKQDMIKAIVIKDVDDNRMAEIAIIENLQREDLTLFDEIEAISKLKIKKPHDIAKVLNKSLSYIKRRITAFELIRKWDIRDRSLTLTEILDYRQNDDLNNTEIKENLSHNDLNNTEIKENLSHNDNVSNSLNENLKSIDNKNDSKLNNDIMSDEEINPKDIDKIEKKNSTKKEDKKKDFEDIINNEAVNNNIVLDKKMLEEEKELQQQFKNLGFEVVFLISGEVLIKGNKLSLNKLLDINIKKG